MIEIAKYHGKRGYAIIEGIGLIEHMHGWTISTSRDKADASEQCQEWHDSLVGQGIWSGSLSAWYDGANVGKFYDVVNSTSSKDVYIYPVKTDMTKYFYGDAWVDFDLAGPVDANVDISGTLSGTGQLLESGF